MDMLAFLKFLDARLAEPSTYAGLSALLVALHVSIPAGVWAQVVLWGGILSGVAAVLLSELGTKPPAQIAGDVLAAFINGVKAAPNPNPNPDTSTSTLVTAAKTVVTALLLAFIFMGVVACSTSSPVTKQLAQQCLKNQEGAVLQTVVLDLAAPPASNVGTVVKGQVVAQVSDTLTDPVCQAAAASAALDATTKP